MKVSFATQGWQTFVADLSGAEVEILARIQAKAVAVERHYDDSVMTWIKQPSRKLDLEIAVTTLEVVDAPVIEEETK